MTDTERLATLETQLRALQRTLESYVARVAALEGEEERHKAGVREAKAHADAAERDAKALRDEVRNLDEGIGRLLTESSSATLLTQAVKAQLEVEARALRQQLDAKAQAILVQVEAAITRALDQAKANLRAEATAIREEMHTADKRQDDAIKKMSQLRRALMVGAVAMAPVARDALLAIIHR